METDYFKKVYIKSEDDLPKEAGFYFVNWTPGHAHNTTMGVVYYDESIKGLWFGKGWYDWHLLPVTLPSDEEIEAEIHKQCTFRAGDEEYTNSLNERERIIGAKWVRDKLTAK
jgi:hypothetical protein